MKKMLLRIEYCDNDCEYPDNEYCLLIAADSMSSCVRCNVQRIPDDNWICEHCKKEFDRLDKFFEVTTGPDLDDIISSPEVAPNVRAVPLIANIKRLCPDCFSTIR